MPRQGQVDCANCVIYKRLFCDIRERSHHLYSDHCYYSDTSRCRFVLKRDPDPRRGHNRLGAVYPTLFARLLDRAQRWKIVTLKSASDCIGNELSRREVFAVGTPVYHLYPNLQLQQHRGTVSSSTTSNRLNMHANCPHPYSRYNITPFDVADKSSFPSLSWSISEGQPYGSFEI